jgi:hypothetical protein
MPQNIAVRLHATVTCGAIGDLNTISFAGDNQNSVTIKNNGTGVIWISFDPTVTASSGSASCYSLKAGEIYTRNHVLRNSIFTFASDTAATVVTIAVSPFP